MKKNFQLNGIGAALGLLLGMQALSTFAADAMKIDVSGQVGIGTETPSAKLHVIGDGDDVAAQVLVENANTATPGIARILFKIVNDGPAKFSMVSSESDEWAFNALDNEFRISKQLTGDREMVLSDTGNLTITGSLTEGSSRTIKHDIEVVDARAVLEKVVAMPIATWSYNRDPEGIQHLGPMAEDFYSAFGLGHTAKGIASVDTSGVALAAIQGLKREKDTEVARLKAENIALKDALYQLRAEQDERRAEQDGLSADHDERMIQLEMALAEVLRHQSSGVQVGSAN